MTSVLGYEYVGTFLFFNYVALLNVFTSCGRTSFSPLFRRFTNDDLYSFSTCSFTVLALLIVYSITSLIHDLVSASLM